MTKIETISDNTIYKGGFFILSFAAQPNLYWVKNNQAGTIMKLTYWFSQSVGRRLSGDFPLQSCRAFCVFRHFRRKRLWMCVLQRCR